MKREYIISVIVLTTIVAGVFVLLSRGQTPASLDNMENLPVSGENTVIYINSGYSPKELRVEKGVSVTFVNQSDLAMWTASDPHPIHTDYPNFDPKEGVDKGKSYSYTFEEPGTYNYHNHLSPQHTGIIIVE